MKMQNVTDDAPSNDDLIIIFMFIHLSLSLPLSFLLSSEKMKNKKETKRK